MNQGTYPLAASMINQINRVDLISNNLANANTVGFKQEALSEGSFNHYLDKAREENFKPSKISTVLNTIPKIDTKYVIDTQGSVVATGNKMDFALMDKNAFFKVQNEKGEVLLSKNGTFHILNNTVVNGIGQKILDANNEPIASEEGLNALLGLVKTDFTNLEKIGNNNYRVLDSEKLENIDVNDEYLIQGSVEKSNVNSIHTMVSLIEAQRKFAQTQKAIQSINEIEKSTIDKLGR